MIADEFVGPPIGGLLFAAAIALPVAVTGGAYAAAALFFLALTGRFRPERLNGHPRSLRREMIEGAGWLGRHGLLRTLSIITGLSSIAYMMPFSILVLFAQDVLGLEPAGYGILLSVSALGGLAGSVIAVPVRRKFGYAGTAAGSLVVGSLTLVATSLTVTPWITGLCLAAYILHAVVYGICVASIRQRLVPDGLRGRVNSVSKLLALAGLTIGAGLGGMLASSFGLEAPFLAGGIIFGFCALIAWQALRNWEDTAAGL